MLSFSLDAEKTDFSMRQHSLELWIVLLVGGVFCAEVPVSVMEGDSVTLISNVTEIQNEELKWMINDSDIIARIDGETKNSSVPGSQAIFKGRLQLNNATGSLTITNILRSDARDYKLKIRSTNKDESKTFKVTVNDEMKGVSVIKGELVTLRTGTIQKYDLLLWKYEDHLIAKLNRSANEYSLYDSRNKQFKGRLQRNNESGSLTISNSATTDSGDYHLEMSCSTHSLQRTIPVTVSNLVSSLTAVLGIIILVQLLVFAALSGLGFLWHQRKISDLQLNRRRDPAGERNGLENNHDADELRPDTRIP